MAATCGSSRATRCRRTPSFPKWRRRSHNLPVRDVILDGEATGVWFKQGRIAYHIFDILWIDGRDVTGLPIEKRQALLAKLPLKSPLVRVPSLRGRVGLGARPVDYFSKDRKEFLFAGKVGTGLDTKLLRSPPAARHARGRRAAVHHREGAQAAIALGTPEIVVQVAFTEWTEHVLLPDDGITHCELAAYYEAIAVATLCTRQPAACSSLVTTTQCAGGIRRNRLQLAPAARPRIRGRPWCHCEYVEPAL
jgi:hypothetical protein